METCENCGKQIGNLETPHLHDGHVVCWNCKVQLAPVAEYESASTNAAGRPKRLARTAVAIGTLTIVGVVGFLLLGHSRTNTTPSAGPVPTPVATVAPSQSAIASAIAPISKGSIAGSIWVERKDGTSIPLRGVEVRLIKATVSPQTYYACIKSQYDSDVELANENIKRAAERANDQIEAEVAKESAAASQKDAAALKQLGATVTMNMPPVDAMKVYESLASRNRFALADIGHMLADNHVARVTSGADATYSFADVPVGKYYLYADKDTGVFNITWLVPVTVAADKQVQVNLFNENAVHIRNKH